MRVGIFGGTFDPIHNGHMSIAEEARAQAALDEVIFIPAGNPWMKNDRVIASSATRVEMIDLALSDNPLFRVSLKEIKRRGETYTVETLEEIKGELGNEVRLFFILGEDAFGGMSFWKNPERLLEICSLLVFRRKTIGEVHINDLHKENLKGRATIVECPNINISSTQIRDRLSRGETIKHLVPPKVEEYIKTHELYRGGKISNEVVK